MNRGFILDTAREITTSHRNKAYGEPDVNLGLAGRIKEILWDTYKKNCPRYITPGEREAIDLCVTKLSRIAVGALQPDNYIDLAAYAAIAGEIATKMENVRVGGTSELAPEGEAKPTLGGALAR